MKFAETDVSQLDRIVLALKKTAGIRMGSILLKQRRMNSGGQKPKTKATTTLKVVVRRKRRAGGAIMSLATWIWRAVSSYIRRRRWSSCRWSWDRAFFCFLHRSCRSEPAGHCGGADADARQAVLAFAPMAPVLESRLYYLPNADHWSFHAGSDGSAGGVAAPVLPASFNTGGYYFGGLPRAGLRAFSTA